mmetsp:Transcript_120704/g.301155  ORF Transcript_120704/g.301155 Transcript_120704/m.301155 type:complete len:207 (-) Transcript_120704:1524-2144(-)
MRLSGTPMKPILLDPHPPHMLPIALQGPELQAPAFTPSTICAISANLASPMPGTTLQFPQVGIAQIQWQGWQLIGDTPMSCKMDMDSELPSFCRPHGCKNSSELWSLRCSASLWEPGHRFTSWSKPKITDPPFSKMCKGGAFSFFKSIAAGKDMRTSCEADSQITFQLPSRIAFQASRNSAMYNAPSAAGIEGGVMPKFWLGPCCC